MSLINLLHKTRRPSAETPRTQPQQQQQRQDSKSALLQRGSSSSQCTLRSSNSSATSSHNESTSSENHQPSEPNSSVDETKRTDPNKTSTADARSSHSNVTHDSSCSKFAQHNNEARSTHHNTMSSSPTSLHGFSSARRPSYHGSTTNQRFSSSISPIKSPGGKKISSAAFHDHSNYFFIETQQGSEKMTLQYVKTLGKGSTSEVALCKQYISCCKNSVDEECCTRVNPFGSEKELNCSNLHSTTAGASSHSHSPTGDARRQLFHSYSLSPSQEEDSARVSSDVEKCPSPVNVENQSHSLVAVKIIHRSFLSKKSLSSGPLQKLSHLKKEMAIVQRCHHPNIVKLIDVIDDPECDKIYLIFEYCSGGPIVQLDEEGFVKCNPKRTLSIPNVFFPSLIDNRSGLYCLPEAKCRRYMSQVVDGLLYMHKKHLTHLDLKPANLLLDQETDTLKISDFGLSNQFTGHHDQVADCCGSPAFYSPERCNIYLDEHGGYEVKGSASDVWALGVCLYTLVMGRVPFTGESAGAAFLVSLYENICHDEPVFSDRLSEPLIDLLCRMLHKTPEKRLTLDEVRAHPWLCKVRHPYLNGAGLESASESFSSFSKRDSTDDDSSQNSSEEQKKRQTPSSPKKIRKVIRHGVGRFRSGISKLFESPEKKRRRRSHNDTLMRRKSNVLYTPPFPGRRAMSLVVPQASKKNLFA